MIYYYYRSVEKFVLLRNQTEGFLIKLLYSLSKFSPCEMIQICIRPIHSLKDLVELSEDISVTTCSYASTAVSGELNFKQPIFPLIVGKRKKSHHARSGLLLAGGFNNSTFSQVCLPVCLSSLIMLRTVSIFSGVTAAASRKEPFDCPSILFQQNYLIG